MENAPNDHRKPSKSPLILIISIIGAVAFVIFGVFLFAFVILPSLISTNTIKSMVESKLNEAISNNSPSETTIAGASTSEINPFLELLQSRQLRYQWKTGETHGYEFSLWIGDEQKSTFKVQGDCQYTIGNEKIVENKRTAEGTGLAFVIAPGYLATSAHVVKVAERIQFVSATKRYAAKIIDLDSTNDLAILAYEGEEAPLELGSDAKLESAESVWLTSFPAFENLAAGIKVEPSKVSNVDASRGRQAISIDAAINPMNSGGPVINTKGEVVGLANAPTQGEPQNDRGFASRVDGLRDLMTKNNIAANPSTTNSVLDSEEITKRLSSSVGRLDVSNWVDNRWLEIDYLANYTGTIKSPVVFHNGVRKEGLAGKMLVSRLGEVQSFVKLEQLPFVLASIPELVFQPFDLVAEDRWTFYRNYESEQTPPSSPGAMMRTPLRDRRTGKEPGIPGELKSEFEVLSSDQDVIRIRKSRHFQIRADKSQPPSIEVKGDGVWEFDTKQGLPISVQENLTVVNRTNGKASESPLFYKVTRIDPAIVQDRLRLAQEQAEKQKNEQEIERTQPNPALIDQLVAQLDVKNIGECSNALIRLSNIAIVEEKRDTTLQSLRAIIAGKNSVLHGFGWRAYMHWMTVACAPELRRIISKSPTHKDSALSALVALKQEEDLPLIIANLSRLSFDAKKSLSSFGLKVEPAVLEKLVQEKDTFAQIELLRTLEEVGTQQSLDKLSELKSTGDLGFQIRVESTTMTIQRRMERNKK